MGSKLDPRLLALKALAHPRRFELMREVVRCAGPVPSATLAGRLRLPRSTLSEHLAVLEEAGLIVRHPQDDGTLLVDAGVRGVDAAARLLAGMRHLMLTRRGLPN